MSVILLIGLLILAIATGICFAFGLKRLALTLVAGTLLLVLANVILYLAIAQSKL